MKILEQILLALLFLGFAFMVLLICADRAEKINSGEITVISEDYMDRQVKVMNERYDEDFNMPEWIKVDINEYFNLKEDLDYYKQFKNFVKEEIESKADADLKIKTIKDLAEMLEKNLHHQEVAMVLNENIHEFDDMEKKQNIFKRIYQWFVGDDGEYNKLLYEHDLLRSRYGKLEKRYKRLLRSAESEKERKKTRTKHSM